MLIEISKYEYKYTNVYKLTLENGLKLFEKIDYRKFNFDDNIDMFDDFLRLKF